MQITETGYYETRDGGLAYIIGIMPESFSFDYPVIGFINEGGNSWSEATIWELSGHEYASYCNRHNDLIRYIGKEPPEEKPEEKEPDDYWYNMSNDLFKENNKLYTLIATQMLGWSEYPVKYNRSQKVFAPSQEIADTLELGRNLFKFVSEEIDRRIAEKEKPQPERVELSKLWVCWEQWSENWIISDPKWASLKAAQDYARGYNTTNYGRIKAITPADATSFVIGEGLE